MYGLRYSKQSKALVYLVVLFSVMVEVLLSTDFRIAWVCVRLRGKVNHPPVRVLYPGTVVLCTGKMKKKKTRPDHHCYVCMLYIIIVHEGGSSLLVTQNCWQLHRMTFHFQRGRQARGGGHPRLPVWSQGH